MADYRNSTVAEYIRCPLSFHLRHNLHLQKIDDDSGEHHLRYGIAFHEALRILYTEHDLEKAKRRMRECYPTQLDVNDLAKTLENAYFALEKYVEHYNWDKQWEVLATEKTDWTGDYVAVTPDMIVRDSSDNIFIVDHKTTQRYLNYDYFADYDPNAQVTHYIRRIKERFGHCDGFIVNAIRFSFLKRNSKERSVGFNVEFERQVFQRTPAQLERTAKSTSEWIKDIERSRASNYWRAAETPSACKFCHYKAICSAGWDVEEDEELITNLYRYVCSELLESGEYCNQDTGHEGACGFVLSTAVESEFVVEI